MDSRFKPYSRVGLSYLRPYEPGEDLSDVSVSGEDDPETDLGFIAINPDKPKDQWYVARAYAEKHLTSAPWGPGEADTSPETRFAFVTHLAKTAYEAYCEHADWKNFEGNPIPQWDDLPEETGVQDKWRTAAVAVFKAARIGPAHAGAALHQYLQRTHESAPNGWRMFLDSVCPEGVADGPWMTVGVHPIDVDGETILLHVSDQGTAEGGYVQVEMVPDPTKESRAWRKQLDDVLQRIKHPFSERTSRERSLSATKIEEGIMWLGMDLKAQRAEGIHDEPNPYPNSYDGSSDAPIAPTADGLTL